MAASETSPLLSTPPPSASPQKHNATPDGSQDVNESVGKSGDWKSRVVSKVQIAPRNQGILFIVAAEVVGAGMDATARFVQQDQGGKGVSVFQVIFFRMSITWVLSSLYSWWTKVPDFPLGPSRVRGLLFARALFGSLGLFCLYFSVHYLTLTESTVVRFLVPLTTTLLCALLLAQSLTSRDIIAGLLSLIGVLIMAHPEAIFGSPHHQTPQPHTHPKLFSSPEIDPVSPTQHIVALSISLLGVFFAASAYTSIRLIGNTTHALISVSYFSALSTLFTLAIFIFHPTADTTFVIPSETRDWVLLIGLGVAGFVLQFLLTKGLQMDKSSRATSMLYLQVVFAALLDWCVWGVLPALWSWIGGGIVVASTLWVALGKVKSSETAEGDGERRRLGDEEERLLVGDDASEEDVEDEQREEVISEAVIVRRASISA